MPCLLIGGLLADRFGARPIVVTGSVAAAIGNLVLLVWQTTPGLLVGRLVVGLGVGLTISAGTAWAARLRGASGVVLAGIVMTTGFAVGPIASGIFAYFLTDTATMTVPFVVTIILSGIAAVAALAVRPDSPPATSRRHRRYNTGYLTCTVESATGTGNRNPDGAMGLFDRSRGAGDLIRAREQPC